MKEETTITFSQEEFRAFMEEIKHAWAIGLAAASDARPRYNYATAREKVGQIVSASLDGWKRVAAERAMHNAIAQGREHGERPTGAEG